MLVKGTNLPCQVGRFCGGNGGPATMVNLPYYVLGSC